MAIPELPAVPGVRHRDIRVNGVRLHVAEAGAGPPLILLHGWPQHWWCWRRVIPRLVEDYRVIAPDLRGSGWSDAPRDDYAKSTFAADIVALMDVEGLDGVHLVGHDWGGFAAFLIALEHPGRIHRMVALDVAPPWLGQPRPRHLAAPLLGSYQAFLAVPMLAPRALTSSNAFVRWFIRAGSGAASHWSDDELDRYAEVLRAPARAAATSACYRTFLTRELPAVLLGGHEAGDLVVPTLLVMGESSLLRRVLDPQPSRNLRVEQISGAGHFLPEEAPTLLLDLVLAHLAS